METQTAKSPGDIESSILRVINGIFKYKYEISEFNVWKTQDQKYQWCIEFCISEFQVK